MSIAEAEKASWRFSFPIDFGWRNGVFALRTAVAAVFALALAYRLELSDPQWATLTVYLLAQPTVGAAVAKGLWRTAGTVSGGALGLVLVALFSQAPELLVGATVLLVGLAFYLGATLRNYASYGVLLAGYTMLLVAYEGSAAPNDAWSIAGDRIAEILIGIACVTTASALVAPRYAGEALRESLARVFAGLAHYSAAALRPGAPLAAFAELRRRMVADVVQFDALRSYTLFEAPERRADDQALRRTVDEFLLALSIARGLYFRLDDFGQNGAQAVLARLRPALDAAAATLERVAIDSSTAAEPRRVRRQLLAAHETLSGAAADLRAMAGKAPFDPLADGLLVANRAMDLLHALSMVIVLDVASAQARSRRTPAPTRRREGASKNRREAALIALRSALALALLSAFWMASAWDMGFTAVSGGAIMLFFGVNQDDPMPAARAFLVWSSLGVAAAYAIMILVLPYIEAFEALALVLVLALLPAGLMAGTPSRAWSGIAFGGFIISQLSIGNAAAPNELAFVNGALALILGMVACLIVLAAFPVTSRSERGNSWRKIMGRILPEAARGVRPPRSAGQEVVAILAALLPRLALGRRRDDEFLRGSLGAASAAVELSRLAQYARDPSMPPKAAQTMRAGLDAFAQSLERLTQPGGDKPGRLTEAEAIIDRLRAELARQPFSPGTAAAEIVLRGGASLRFIADRFVIDRSFLELRFTEE